MRNTKHEEYIKSKFGRYMTPREYDKLVNHQQFIQNAAYLYDMYIGDLNMDAEIATKNAIEDALIQHRRHVGARNARATLKKGVDF